MGQVKYSTDVDLSSALSPLSLGERRHSHDETRSHSASSQMGNFHVEESPQEPPLSALLGVALVTTSAFHLGSLAGLLET